MSARGVKKKGRSWWLLGLVYFHRCHSMHLVRRPDSSIEVSWSARGTGRPLTVCAQWKYSTALLAAPREYCRLLLLQTILQNVRKCFSFCFRLKKNRHALFQTLAFNNAKIDNIHKNCVVTFLFHIYLWQKTVKTSCLFSVIWHRAPERRIYTNPLTAWPKGHFWRFLLPPRGYTVSLILLIKVFN